MALNWFTKNDGANFKINSRFLHKYLLPNIHTDSQALTCFSHVPKTGGTSLESILAKNFLPSRVLHINAQDLNKQPEVLKLKRNPPRMVCGHHPMHGLLYQILPEHPLFHFTQLRNPIDRVLSYYNYVLGKTDHPFHHHAKGKNITEFMQLESSPELSNGQTKRFSGFLHNGKTDDKT